MEMILYYDHLANNNLPLQPFFYSNWHGWWGIGSVRSPLSWSDDVMIILIHHPETMLARPWQSFTPENLQQFGIVGTHVEIYPKLCQVKQQKQNFPNAVQQLGCIMIFVVACNYCLNIMIHFCDVVTFGNFWWCYTLCYATRIWCYATTCYNKHSTKS